LDKAEEEGRRNARAEIRCERKAAQGSEAGAAQAGSGLIAQRPTTYTADKKKEDSRHQTDNGRQISRVQVVDRVEPTGSG
jgi:hypothetical protein